MKDTPLAIEERYIAMLQRVGPQRRLAMGARMLDAAKTLARAGIIDRLGHDDEAAVRRELFLRFYGDDLPEPHRTRALERVMAARPRPSFQDAKHLVTVAIADGHRIERAWRDARDARADAATLAVIDDAYAAQSAHVDEMRALLRQIHDGSSSTSDEAPTQAEMSELTEALRRLGRHEHCAPATSAAVRCERCVRELDEIRTRRTSCTNAMRRLALASRKNT